MVSENENENDDQGEPDESTHDSSPAHSHANDWDRRPGESRQAYGAFRAYLDMGPTRSVYELGTAARAKNQNGGIQGGNRGSNAGDRQKKGSYSRHQEWSKVHHWLDRAQAYDSYIERLSLEAAVRTAAAETAAKITRLMRLREEDYEEAIEDGDQLIKQGRYLSRFPAKTERREKAGPNGEDLVIEAANAATIRTGKGLIESGRMMKRDAIRDALAALMPQTDRGTAYSNNGDATIQPRRRAAYIEVEVSGDGDDDTPEGIGGGSAPTLPGPGQ